MHYFHVDAFAKSVFSGNPAAVFLVDEFPSTSIMQSIAAELNLSQSAFVKSLADHRYHIRWFSPKDETPICGHATLASAHVLWKELMIDDDEILFDSLAGPLSVKKEPDDWTRLNFPLKPLSPYPVPVGLGAMLGIDDQEIQSFWGDDLIYMVQLQSPIALYHLNPKLHEIAQLDRRALCVSVINDGTFGEAIDYASRYFAPKVGIYEDPVCGSSHCRLAPFWAQRLKKNELIAYQASSRGGVLRLWVDELHQRVHISGQAITVGRGVLNPKSLETLYQ